MMQTVVMGVVNILFTLIAIFTVEKMGRKPLLIVGSIGMAVGRELEDRGRGAAHPVAAAVAAGLLSALLPPRAELPVCHD